MRRSLPMAEATSCTSAPSVSHRSATSLMKLILSARKALAAYLASSAELAPDEHDRRVAQGERLVEPRHQFARALVVEADEHAVGMHEVLDGRALAQELRVRAHGEIGIRTQRAQPALDLAARSHRHRRLGDDDGEAVEMRRHLLDRGVDVGEIRVAVAAAHGRADGEQNDVGRCAQPPQIVGEEQTLGLHVALDEVVEPRLVDRRAASLEIGKPLRVLVDAGDRPAELGKAGRGDEPDIAGADHADVQRFLPLTR